MTGPRVAAGRRGQGSTAAAASSGSATTLAKQSGASRTSPILRGNWVVEVLLGEKLPRPPKGVPQLPDDEAATDGLTVRQLVEKHASDAEVRGLPRSGSTRSASRSKATTPSAAAARRTWATGRSTPDARLKDGTEFDGLDGLRTTC